MRARRFKVSSLDVNPVRVDGAEAGHALRVLRLTPGSPVVLFDGRGGEADGVITSIADGAFEVELTGPMRRSGHSALNFVVVSAVPKGDRADWLVEKCAELGVDAIQWIETERSIVEPGANKLERWRRKAAETAKQCESPVVMDIREPRPLSDYIASTAADCELFFGEPDGEIPAFIDALLDLTPSANVDRPVAFIVGPEGGLSAAETSMLKSAGAKPVRLATTILRVETAAVAAASIVSCVRAGKLPGR